MVTCGYFSNLINIMHLFNHMCAGQRHVHAWFLIIAFALEVGMCVRVCVCPHPKAKIASGMIWTPYDWLNYSYSAQLQLVSLVGVALEMKSVIETNLLRIS